MICKYFPHSFQGFSCFCPHCLTIKLNIWHFENGLLTITQMSNPIDVPTQKRELHHSFIGIHSGVDNAQSYSDQNQIFSHRLPYFLSHGAPVVHHLRTVFSSAMTLTHLSTFQNFSTAHKLWKLTTIKTYSTHDLTVWFYGFTWISDKATLINSSINFKDGLPEN